jgi:NAD dependent epimerase/dehydratase family enzyme
MLLASQKVVPERLLQAGFRFEDERLEPALRKMFDSI